MFSAGRKHGKKTRAARSQTREKPSCRKILTLCKVPERGAAKPLPKQRARAGPGRPDTRRNKGGVGRAAVGERSGIDAGKGPGRAEPVPPFPATRRCRKSAEHRRRAAFFRGTATLPMPRGRKKNARTPGCCNDARILPERARPGANGRRARKFSPAAPRREKFPKTHGRGGAGRLRLREKTPPPGLRGAPLRVRPGAEAELPCPEGSRNARRKTPERGTKKSGRTPPPATESGRAPSVKTTQMRTT